MAHALDDVDYEEMDVLVLQDRNKYKHDQLRDSTDTLKKVTGVSKSQSLKRKRPETFFQSLW